MQKSAHDEWFVNTHSKNGACRLQLFCMIQTITEGINVKVKLPLCLTKYHVMKTYTLIKHHVMKKH